MKKFGINLLLIIVLFAMICGCSYQIEPKVKGEQIARYRPIVVKYADEYEITEYIPYLLAIIEVESGGIGNDIMQASESLGLSPNSLSKERSVKQGCAYFASLLAISRTKNCDFDSVLQAYNYGPAYLDYIAEHGHKHSLDLAIEYAKTKSHAEKLSYTNPIALKHNSGWRYSYGNMFYVELIKKTNSLERWNK